MTPAGGGVARGAGGQEAVATDSRDKVTTVYVFADPPRPLSGAVVLALGAMGTELGRPSSRR